MTAFELSREYDVITCLFSAIGYVQTVGNTVKALRNFLNHLRPGGILLVEPWIDPAKFLAGAVFLRTVNDDDLKVARMSANEIDGKLSRITFEYLIGEGGRVTRETEVHELALLTRQEMANCFTEAGLEYEYDEFGLMDRGLFIGRR
jgi:SAM-dependent methyltransferase